MIKLKKAAALLLCVFICFAFAPLFANEAYAGNSTTIGEDQESLKELKAKLDSIKQKRENLNKSKNEMGDEFNNAYAQKVSLENDISLLEDEISVTTKLVSDYLTQIEDLTGQLYEEQTKIENLYDDYDQIVVYYYKNGNPSSFELLLESDSLSSFLTKKDYVEYILEYMNKIVAEIGSAKIDLENTMSVYETSKKDLETYNDSLSSSKSDYEKQIAELDILMADNKKGFEETQEQIDKYNDAAEELERQIAELNEAISEKYTYIEGDYSWPIAADYWGSCYVSSGFGYRKDPFSGENAFHNGIDIAAPNGTPVQAVKSGKVIRSEYSGSYGDVIVISHEDGTATLYAHLSKRMVEYGDTVLQNQIIGKVGKTGRANGYHLHFGVYKGSELVDPSDYLDDYFKDALDIYDYLN